MAQGHTMAGAGMLGTLGLVGCAVMLSVGGVLAVNQQQTPAKTPQRDASAPALNQPGGTPEQIIRDLEQAAGSRGTVNPGTQAQSQPGMSGAVGGMGGVGGRLLREGTLLSSRNGRMVRGQGGEWLLVFDASADSVVDPPMVLMPCLNLMAMERVAERGGESVTFSVSGQVFVYRGRNYLLPTMYVVNRRGELTPGG